MPRTPNATVEAIDALNALAAILPPNTQYTLSGAAPYVNDDSALQLGTCIWPALLIVESNPQPAKKVGMYVWQQTITALVALLDKVANNTSAASYDAQYNALEIDFDRMCANVEDNSRLSVNGVVHAKRVERYEATPFDKKAIDTSSYSSPVVTKMASFKIVLPPYVSGS